MVFVKFLPTSVNGFSIHCFLFASKTTPYYICVRFALASNMEEEAYGCNKHETYDALIASYEKATSEYDEVK